MRTILAVRNLDKVLYNRLRQFELLILNFHFDFDECINGENIVNINMNDYGVMNPDYILVREYALEKVIDKYVSNDDKLLLYVKDIDKFDCFLNITNKSHFISSIMHKRRYMNYYLYRIPTILEMPSHKEVLNNHLNELIEYGNVIPVPILRNFLIRNRDTTNHIMAANVTNAILGIISGNDSKEHKSKVY